MPIHMVVAIGENQPATDGVSESPPGLAHCPLAVARVIVCYVIRRDAQQQSQANYQTNAAIEIACAKDTMPGALPGYLIGHP